MIKILAKIAAAAVVVATLAGCAQMGDGMNGMGQVARNTCRAPMPIYTKGEVSHRYVK